MACRVRTEGEMRNTEEGTSRVKTAETRKDKHNKRTGAAGETAEYHDKWGATESNEEERQVQEDKGDDQEENAENNSIDENMVHSIKMRCAPRLKTSGSETGAQYCRRAGSETGVQTYRRGPAGSEEEETKEHVFATRIPGGMSLRLRSKAKRMRRHRSRT